MSTKAATTEGVDSTMSLEIPITDGNRDRVQQQAKIPMDPVLVDAIHRMAAAGDPSALELRDHVYAQASTHRYAAYGISVRGDRADLTREARMMRQEIDLLVTAETPMPEGTRIKTRTASGKELVIATYEVAGIGGAAAGRFVVNASLPPGIRDRYDRMSTPGDHAEVDAQMISAWARTLLTEPDTLPVDVAVILGLSATLVPTGARLDVQPPPPGSRKATIHLAGDAFDALEVEVESAVTTAALEQRLGQIRILGAGRIGFRVVESNARNVCDVTVTVDSGQVRRVSMKRARA